MKEDAAIDTRIGELKERLALISRIREEEMKRTFRSRDFAYLNWLSREQKIYEFGVSQLKWLIDKE